jgi:predicted metal-dependent peptidase
MVISEKDLAMRNYYVVIDRSGSMGEPVSSFSKVSRWDAVKEYAVTVARECDKLDDDGIDVYLFNKNFIRFENTTADKVDDIFKKHSPAGGTDFIPVLTDVFDRHFKSDKPSTVLVFTDGEPSEGEEGQKALAKLLVATANRLEGDSELGISFVQIGNDPKASAFLKKLDDDLVKVGAKFDIVDTKTCDDLDNISVQDLLVAAVND